MSADAFRGVLAHALGVDDDGEGYGPRPGESAADHTARVDAIHARHDARALELDAAYQAQRESEITRAAQGYARRLPTWHAAYRVASAVDHGLCLPGQDRGAANTPEEIARAWHTVTLTARRHGLVTELAAAVGVECAQLAALATVAVPPTSRVEYARVIDDGLGRWVLDVPGADLYACESGDEAACLTAAATLGWRYVGPATGGGSLVVREVTA